MEGRRNEPMATDSGCLRLWRGGMGNVIRIEPMAFLRSCYIKFLYGDNRIVRYPDRLSAEGGVNVILCLYWF